VKAQKCIMSAIEKADERESKLAALQLLLEFGTSAEKEDARKEIANIAFGRTGMN
jgi:hypothetical protein